MACCEQHPRLPAPFLSDQLSRAYVLGNEDVFYTMTG